MILFSYWKYRLYRILLPLIRQDRVPLRSFYPPIYTKIIKKYVYFGGKQIFYVKQNDTYSKQNLFIATHFLEIVKFFNKEKEIQGCILVLKSFLLPLSRKSFFSPLVPFYEFF